MQIITDVFQKEVKEHGNFQFPLLVSPERLSRYETGSFMWHWHPEIELTLVTKGQILYRVNNKAFHLQENQVLFCNAGSLHAGAMIDNQDCHYMSITFDPKLIYGYDNSIIYEKYVLPVTANPAIPAIVFDQSKKWHSAVLSSVKNIIRLHGQKEAAWEMDLIAQLQNFWKNMFLHLTPAFPLTGKERTDYQRIRRILSYIASHYQKKLTLAEIAADVCLCPSECSRLFKQYMKQPLFEFILEYRIEKSLSYLANSAFTITQAAGEVGFRDSNYFSKVFLRIKGYSPSVYRKQLAGSCIRGAK